MAVSISVRSRLLALNYGTSAFLLVAGTTGSYAGLIFIQPTLLTTTNLLTSADKKLPADIFYLKTI